MRSKTSLQSGEILVTVDFSENYSKKEIATASEKFRNTYDSRVKKTLNNFVLFFLLSLL